LFSITVSLTVAAHTLGVVPAQFWAGQACPQPWCVPVTSRNPEANVANTEEANFETNFPRLSTFIVFPSCQPLFCSEIALERLQFRSRSGFAGIQDEHL
jgi:hypothetical protein